MSLWMGTERDAGSAVIFGIEIGKPVAEARDAQERRTPVGNSGEIVDEPAQRILHLVEGTDHHHQAAQRQAASEEAGYRNQYRNDDRQPAITRGDPAQAG